jgi:DEAD/DEAH box helicase domain-containing protein
MGIGKLFAHQAQAINAARRGEHVIISTATSSGKSLVYHLPAFEKLIDEPQSHVALYMFPTKALAQDQLRSIGSFVGECSWVIEWQMVLLGNNPAVSSDSSRAHIYPTPGAGAGYMAGSLRTACIDGDSTREEREDARRNANVLLTNPDMLHATLLPDHARWCRWANDTAQGQGLIYVQTALFYLYLNPLLLPTKRLFKKLHIVVIDEAHIYRGAFGSHVACVLRR